MSRICVAMSTYNGAKYIEQQLESILAQDEPGLSVVIADDCSSDTTVSILDGFAARDSRIQYGINPVNLGVNGSFREALRRCPSSEFYCLSDQDDLWPPDRIAQFMSSYEKLIADGADPTVPTLLVCQYRIFHDGEVCNDSSPTSFSLLSLDNPNINWKKTLLTGNSLYGCCFFFNSALKELIDEIPPGRTTHDYWITLVAAYLGNLVLVPFVGTHYRQHSSNASYGAPSRNWIVKFRRIRRSLDEDLRARKDICLLLSELRRQHGGRLRPAERDNLDDAVRAYKAGSLKLAWFQVSRGAWRQSLSANLLRLWSCMIEPSRPRS